MAKIKNARNLRLVIPAAGSGIRLAGADNSIPKLLIPIAGRPIISHLLRMASSIGCFSHIVVILGPYCNDVFQVIKELTSGIKWKTATEIVCIENAKFEWTNNIYSVYLARDYLKGNVIVHNSDVLLSPSLLARLTSFKDSTQAWVSADNAASIAEVETKLIVGKGNRVLRFGESIPSVMAEGRYIGVTRFHSDTVRIFRDEVVRLVEKGDVLSWYTKAMGSLASLGKLSVAWANDELWCEIDTIEDYRRAASIAKEIVNRIVAQRTGKAAKFLRI